MRWKNHLTVVSMGFALCAVPAAHSQAGGQSKPPIRTGPAVGERIPDFEAADQSGRRQTFETLKGRNGLLLLISRSADW